MPSPSETNERMEAAARLDALCRVTTSAETLNALHACRPGHPLGRGNEHKWRNAWFSVAGNRRAAFDASHRDLDWLKERAIAEGAA